jgi:hypothetical protein
MDFSILDFDIKIFGDDIVSSIDLLKLFISPFLGLYIRVIFEYVFNFFWIKNNANNITYILLPMTGFVITSVISNDIALSLGLVGALSIIRFRTPIKNPAELVIYFILLTLGIVLNVSFTLTLFFVVYLFPILYLIKYFTKYKTSNSKNFSTIDEYNYVLRLQSNKEIKIETLSNLFIINIQQLDNENYSYSFAYKKLSEIDSFLSNKEVVYTSYSIENTKII